MLEHIELIHSLQGARTGAKTAASTLYRSTKLRLTAFMTEGAGLAAVVAAAAKTRGIGCKGDLVRSLLIPSHFAGGSTKISRQNITRTARWW